MRGRRRAEESQDRSPPTARFRRTRALLVVATAIALAAAVLVWSRRGRTFVLEPDANRNVLLLTIDTLRADALSSYGGPARTPNLDRLAARGARFTFAHAHAVVTLPSHTTIFTGQLPYEHGIRDNGGFRVREGTRTLATRLKPLGFATGAFVGGFTVTKRFGLTPGFDVYDDQMPEMKGAVGESMPERRADAVVASAAEWLARQTVKVFAWVHLFDPHSPYKPPDEYLTSHAAQPYYGEVAWVDRAVGQLLDRVASLSRPTLVIVTSDHGEGLGEHGEMTHGMFAYETTLRVPLIVAEIGPGRSSSPQGLVIDEPVRHIDIAPTILDAAGAAADPGLPGASLRDLMRSGDGQQRTSYFEAMTYNLVRGWAPLRGVIAGTEKYVDLPIPELYDLGTDAAEQQNRAGERRDRAAVMANLLRTFDVAPPHRPTQESPEAVAALRSLGYVSGTATVRDSYTEADDPKRLVDVDRDLHKAAELFQNGDSDGAVALLEGVIARRPDTADAYISLAHAYWEAGQPAPAIAALEQALASGAPDRDVRIRLGLYLAESHTDTSKAIALLRGMPADDVEAQNGLGVAYASADRFGEAVETFERVLSLDPTNGIALQNLAAMLLRQALAATSETDRGAKMLAAETRALQALEADATLPDAYTTLGVIQSKSGRRREAIESWKRAVELDAGQFNALYNLWFELASAGRRDEALAYGRRFVATAPPAFFRSDIATISRYIAAAR